jgi:hypothetical protein
MPEMNERITKEQINHHLQMMEKAGLVEVVGVSEDGQEVWAITEFSKSLTEDQVHELIQRTYEEE